jgi:elongation factor G
VDTKSPSEPRCAALVGPYLSGKTTLLESILVATGAVNRKGSVVEGNTVGDSSPESRARHMSTEPNIATTSYLGENWTFIDCPGSVELMQDALDAINVVDITVIVVEAVPDKALAATRLLKVLDERDVPHVLFINKIDAAEAKVKDTLDSLQALSERPLVLREVPIRNGEQVTGYVDLASRRAYEFTDGEEKEIEVPAELADRVEEERTVLLESLADFNDELMEKLLEDEIPETSEVFDHLGEVLRHSQMVPVFFGSAENGTGITRLLKVLRHEASEPSQTAERLGITDGPVARVFKTTHGAHAGKMSLARVFGGEISDGATLNGERVAGIFKLMGAHSDKLAKAGNGTVVALGRLEETHTGALLSTNGAANGVDWPAPLKPVYALAIHAGKREDEVKMASALAKLIEEDPSLRYEPNPDTGELVLRGQGENHLKIALERLKSRNNLEVQAERPQVAYKESIRKPVSQHARHKKQSGGHGQFGDVHVDIKPLPRGSGFQFSDTISGGVVPKQYIPAVENGVKDYLKKGPLGFPVVDVSVTLTDGQFHAVDSSDQAFKTAGALAMREGMPKCNPVLLEPIFQVDISVPSEFTSRVQRLVSGRRGQILGFDAKPGWKGWDEVSVQLPEAETLDLINELRSLSQGTGTFEWKFDHLQEFTGKEADQVVQARAGAD